MGQSVRTKIRTVGLDAGKSETVLPARSVGGRVRRRPGMRATGSNMVYSEFTS
jgi:hypothetical protein